MLKYDSGAVTEWFFEYLIRPQISESPARSEMQCTGKRLAFPKSMYSSYKGQIIDNGAQAEVSAPHVIPNVSEDHDVVVT